MEFINSKEGIKNAKLLWLTFGIFLIPIFDSIDSLVLGMLRLFGLSIMPRLFFSVTLNGVIALCLIGLLVWLIKNWTDNNTHSLRLITLKDFRRYGLICFSIIVAGRATNFFVLTNVDKELELLSDTQKYDIFHNLLNWSLTNRILILARELLMFSVYFLVTFKNK